MSVDFYVTAESFDGFSAEDFFEYAKKFDVNLSVQEEFDITKAEGFQPFLLNVGFIDTVSKEETFLSGFEVLFTNPIPQPAFEHKLTFWQRIFRKKQASVNTVHENLYSKESVLISCSTYDSFEVLLAYILGAYICKNCNGKFDDPQLGRFYDDFSDIELEITIIKEELVNIAYRGELNTHHP